MNPKPRPPEIVAQVQALLHYDPDTGLLTWKVDRPGGVKAGRVITCRMSNGYVKTHIKPHGVLLAHHVAWAIHFGVWPTLEIDHINGDRSDNRIANLRELPDNQNSQNLRSAKKSNRLGVLGVYQLGHRFVAQITVNRQRKHLGMFGTANEAHEAYVAAKRIYHPGNTL